MEKPFLLLFDIWSSSRVTKIWRCQFYDKIERQKFAEFGRICDMIWMVFWWSWSEWCLGYRSAITCQNQFKLSKLAGDSNETLIGLAIACSFGECRVKISIDAPWRSCWLKCTRFTGTHQQAPYFKKYHQSLLIWTKQLTFWGSL